MSNKNDPLKTYLITPANSLKPSKKIQCHKILHHVNNNIFAFVVFDNEEGEKITERPILWLNLSPGDYVEEISEDRKVRTT